MVKAFFFDLTNVLLKKGFMEAAAHYAGELRIKPEKMISLLLDFDGWQKFSLGIISQEEYFRQCSARADSFEFDGSRFFEILKNNAVPNEEIIALARELSGRYAIGVISNSPKEWFDVFISKTGLGDVLKAKAVSGYVHFRKPDEGIFRSALELAGISGEEAIFIDDRPDRVEGAEKLGIRTVFFDGDAANLKERIKKIINPAL